MRKKFFEIPDPGGRLFAIGDIHGCAKELEVMLNYLSNTLGLNQSDYIIFQGDYIDRGPESKRVIEILLSFRKQFANVIFLKGNHEDMLLDFLGFEGRLGEGYLGNGGKECLESYDIASRTSPDIVCQLLPPEHLEFYLKLESGAIHNRFLFVHAGVNPNVPLEWQDEEDVFWIREQFIDFSHEFSQTVIFGHTPFVKVFFDLPFKIGIDTGLVYGNMLTCIELKEGMLYQLRRGASDLIVSSIV